MIFKDKDQLSIIEIDDSDNKVSFEKLATLLMDKPSNMIYCTKAGKLYGIISMGDVHRARENGRNHAEINTFFTFLHGMEYMRARKIFLDNDKINALPIVDEDHSLIGDYTRWDDIYLRYNLEYLKGHKYADLVLKKYKKIAIVKPSCNYALKENLMHTWDDFFVSIGIESEIIHKQDILEAFNDNDIVFFTDEDEIRGVRTLFKDVLGKDIEWQQAETFEYLVKAIGEEVEEAVGEAAAETVIKGIMDTGVYVMTLQILREGEYWRKLYQEIRARWSRIKKKLSSTLPIEFWKDFYNELFTYEYSSIISKQEHTQIINELTLSLKDTESTYYNVKNGNRVTIHQPVNYDKTIYFFGPCLIVGAYTEDKYTIESILQKILNDNGYNVRVVNCGCWSNELMLLFRMTETEFNKGDIAIVFDKDKSFDGIPNLDLGKTLEENNAPAEWFVESVLHTNHRGNELFAKAIYRNLPKWFLKEKTIEKAQKVEVQMHEAYSAYIDRYFTNFERNGLVGAIVMNCNPFTLEYRYLIEKASKQVDKLIIFVVEENRSLFSFNERFAMVVEGTKDIENLFVVPSGNLILSQQTFPEYFVKLEDNDTAHNAELDIRIFAEGIAPELNIKYRFVGEEKNDPVTAEYNKAMKKILPQNGIEVIEISRKTTEGGPISATKVRALLEKKEFEEIKKLVPQTTYNIIMEKME